MKEEIPREMAAVIGGALLGAITQPNSLALVIVRAVVGALIGLLVLWLYAFVKSYIQAPKDARPYTGPIDIRGLPLFRPPPAYKFIILFASVLFVVIVSTVVLVSHMGELNQQVASADHHFSKVEANVWFALLNPGQFWAVYRSSYGETVSPIDAVLIIRVTKLVSVRIDSFAVDLLTSKGWMQLKPILPDVVSVYFGLLENARMVSLEPGWIADRLRQQEQQSISGVGIFEYEDSHYLKPPKVPGTFRITLEDATRTRFVSESTVSKREQPSYSMEGFSIKGTEKAGDLRKLRLKRFSEPID